MSTQTMRALAVLSKDELTLVDLPIPEPDDYEVLVKNEACVFCNTTDKMIVENLFNTPAYPTILGHECFGKVVKVGKKVTKYKLGDRVICSNAIVTGYNGEYYSSFGGFSEYGISGDREAFLADGGVMDAVNKYRWRYDANEVIPSHLSYEKAALAFPLAECASAVGQVGDLTDKTVVVIGTGIVGYFFTLFAKLYGAREVIVLGRRESRLAVTRNIGATATFIDLVEATEHIKRLGGADVVFECSGNYSSLESGLPYLKKDGLFAVYAVPKQPYSFNLLKCPGAFRYQRIDPDVHAAIDEVCKLLDEDKIPVEIFLTHRWSFDEAPAAFEEVRRGNVIKGLVMIA